MPTQRAFMLVPVDVASHSDLTIEWAVKVAKLLNLNIELYYASIPSAEEGMYISVLRDLAALTQRKLSDTDIAVDYLKPQESDPVAAILSRAQADEVDLIMQVTHHKEGWLQAFQSSVTDAVIEKAPCPVLAIPSTANPDEYAGFKRILVPTDLCDTAPMLAAKHWAERFDSTLSYLHVIGPKDAKVAKMLQNDDPVPPETAMMSKAQRQINHYLSLHPLMKSSQPYVVHSAIGDSATEVIHTAAESFYDLIITGHHHRSPLERWLKGSVSEDILHGVHTPVLIVPSIDNQAST